MKNMQDRFAIKWKVTPKNEEPYNETFGQRLKRIRREKAVSQTELEKMSGISKQAICNYECDKIEPSASRLEWLCKALDVTATELLGF